MPPDMTSRTTPRPPPRGRPAAAWPLWAAGAGAVLLLLAAMALWARSGVEIYLTILFNNLALCF